jgi:FtsP/CotA-like multicopper oxidase with cupredoxin domain
MWTSSVRTLWKAIAVAVLFAPLWVGSVVAQGEKRTPPAFREPVTLSSEGGVLEVTLTAHQGEVALDTASVPVKNALLFGYRLMRGKASNGAVAAENSYPAPTLQVFPGERLIVHLENGLSDLTIRDFYDPKYARVGEEVPIYPEQLATSPINFHTHGLHVSPKGNSDNVLLHMPSGTSNTFVYDVPMNMPQALTGIIRIFIL